MAITNDALKDWLARFPYEQLKAEMEEVQGELNKWGQRLTELQEAIRLYERFRGPVSTTNGSHAIAPAVIAKPTLREAVKSVLAESPDREWSSACTSSRSQPFEIRNSFSWNDQVGCKSGNYQDGKLPEGPPTRTRKSNPHVAALSPSTLFCDA